MYRQNNTIANHSIWRHELVEALGYLDAISQELRMSSKTRFLIHKNAGKDASMPRWAQDRLRLIWKRLPYLIREIEPGSKYILLNRAYAPLGLSADFCDPHTWRELFNKHIDSGEPIVKLGEFYLFDDARSPVRTQANFAKYHLLIKELIQPELDLKNSNPDCLARMILTEYQDHGLPTSSRR